MNKPNEFFQNPAPEPIFTHIPVRQGSQLA